METIRKGVDEVDAMRDERLDIARHLLEKPPRYRTPGYVPLLAAIGLLGSAMFLGYVTLPQKPAATPASPVVTQPVTANPADFELSGSAPSAGETTTEAVPLASEAAP